MKNKCHGCKERKPGCHASCSFYQEFKEKMAQVQEAREKHKATDDFVFAVLKHRKTKSRPQGTA